ncbi:methyl-accepting chemotaxis protein [Pseudaeromonas sp. ZJS20]|uniref:methyl-accepting chemotaxis protein n=1 Tax=Pseudaeromonas aegiceratis TaxID=3153928 RepID=UPI00390C53C3
MKAQWSGLRVKISAGLILLTLLLLISSLLNYNALTTLSDHSERIAAHLLPAQTEVLNGDRDLYQALQAEQEALLPGNEGKLAQTQADFDENVQQAGDRMRHFLALMTDYPEVSSRLAGFDTKFDAWHTPSAKVFTLLQAGDLPQARAVHESADEAFSTLREQYNLAGELADQLAQQMHADTRAVSQARKTTTWIIALLSLVIGVSLSYLLPKLIVGGVHAVRGKIDDISMGGGDLVSRLPLLSQDELGQLSQSVNRLLEQLQRLIKDVIGDVGVLEHNTLDMGHIVQQAEAISNNQHERLASLVTAITEISHAVQDISQHAQKTSGQSQEAQTAADEGMALLEQNIRLSQQLSGSVQNAGEIITQLAAESERITSVLDVIRAIADQTNLLALNAAIEAARAGEQGRGFAVVADEVRTLAGRTQHATTDIQSMIGTLKQQVASAVAAMDNGHGQMQASVDMAEQMRASFAAIQGLVAGVQDMNFQIASATEQQSLVMNEINQNVTELDELTQQAHAVSVSVNQSGQAIDALARQLAGRVSQFKV